MNKPMWESLQRLVDTGLAIAGNRVELFAVELREEKCRLVEAILCAVAVAALGVMALTLVTFTVVVLLWDNGRMAALAGLAVLYLTGTFFAWRALQRRLKESLAFAATLEQIKKDRACLETQK